MNVIRLPEIKTADSAHTGIQALFHIPHVGLGARLWLKIYYFVAIMYESCFVLSLV